jgi:ABC-type nitrate/sulfonate/bicarbonate transport system substrate-binding protein
VIGFDLRMIAERGRWKLVAGAPNMVIGKITSVASGWIIVVLLSMWLPSPSSTWAQQAAEPIRLGWQTTWATQGQVVMALRYTDISELAGIRLNFAGFAYGAPLNRAALADQVDVLLTADQPALVLISQDPRFRIVARLMYNRTCLYVPRTADAPTLSGLRGRSVAGPIGAAAERVALDALDRAGVDLAHVQLGNLDMAQQAALLFHAGPGRPWPGVDALFGFDPIVAVFEERGLVSVLECGRVTALVIAREDFIQRREADLGRFLGALRLAWAIFAAEPERLNRLFATQSGLDVTDSALNRSSAEEPNRFARTPREVRLVLGEEDLKNLAVVRDFLQARGLLHLPVDLGRQIDFGPLTRSDAVADWDELGERVHFVPGDK